MTKNLRYSISGLRSSDVIEFEKLKTDELSKIMVDDEYVVVDNDTGYIDVFDDWSWNIDVFIDKFEKASQEYQKPAGDLYYIIPQTRGYNGASTRYGIYKYTDVDDIKHIGFVTNDGYISFDYEYEDQDNFYHKWHNKTLVYEANSFMNKTDMHEILPTIAENIAQKGDSFEKPFKQTKKYVMTFENAKGKIKENNINVKRVKTDEQAINYANELIETWRGGKEDSNIKLLKLESRLENTYRIIDGHAHKVEPEILIDNMTLTSEDLSELSDNPEL